MGKEYDNTYQINNRKEDITLARDNNSYNQDQETKSKPTFYDNVHCTIQ